MSWIFFYKFFNFFSWNFFLKVQVSLPVQFVGKFAFAVEQCLAFVRRMLARGHELFDRWFVHFPFELALAPVRFVASLEIEQLVAMLRPVAPVHFDLMQKKWKKIYWDFDLCTNLIVNCEFIYNFHVWLIKKMTKFHHCWWKFIKNDEVSLVLIQKSNKFHHFCYFNDDNLHHFRLIRKIINKKIWLYKKINAQKCAPKSKPIQLFMYT